MKTSTFCTTAKLSKISALFSTYNFNATYQQHIYNSMFRFLLINSTASSRFVQTCIICTLSDLFLFQNSFTQIHKQTQQSMLQTIVPRPLSYRQTPAIQDMWFIGCIVYHFTKTLGECFNTSSYTFSFNRIGDCKKSHNSVRNDLN